jgi:hypothetical protein
MPEYTPYSSINHYLNTSVLDTHCGIGTPYLNRSIWYGRAAVDIDDLNVKVKLYSWFVISDILANVLARNICKAVA